MGKLKLRKKAATQVQVSWHPNLSSTVLPFLPNSTQGSEAPLPLLCFFPPQKTAIQKCSLSAVVSFLYHVGFILFPDNTFHSIGLTCPEQTASLPKISPTQILPDIFLEFGEEVPNGMLNHCKQIEMIEFSESSTPSGHSGQCHIPG